MFHIMLIGPNKEYASELVRHFYNNKSKRLLVGTKRRNKEIVCPSFSQVVDSIAPLCSVLQGDGHIFRHSIQGFNLDNLLNLEMTVNRDSGNGTRLDLQLRPIFLTALAPRWLTNVLLRASKHLTEFYKVPIKDPIAHLMICYPQCVDQLAHYDSPKRIYATGILAVTDDCPEAGGTYFPCSGEFTGRGNISPVCGRVNVFGSLVLFGGDVVHYGMKNMSSRARAFLYFVFTDDDRDDNY